MIHLGENTLILSAICFLPTLIQAMLTSVYQGLGYIPQLLPIGCLYLVIALAFIFVMFDDYGLVAFGWGDLVGTILSCSLQALYLTRFSANRQLYRFCSA